MEWIVLGALALLFLNRGGSAAPESDSGQGKKEDVAAPESAGDVIDRVGNTLLNLGGAALGSGLLGGGGAVLGGGTGAGTAGIVGGGSAAGGGGGGGGAAVVAPVAAGAAAPIGAILAAALPVGYIVGFIVAGEISKAQERFKDLQSLLVHKGPNASGLNGFEVELIKLELERWRIAFREVAYADPRMRLVSRGSSVVLQGFRRQLFDVNGSGAPGSSDALDFEMMRRHATQLVGRARQAAWEYLSWRGYLVGRIARTWSAAPNINVQHWDLPPGPSYDFLEPGLGGLEQVPDPISGPRSLPADPNNPAPSVGELVANFGASKPGTGCPADVLALARLWALLEALDIARRIRPGATPVEYSQLLAGALPNVLAQPPQSTLVEVGQMVVKVGSENQVLKGWRLPPGDFWGAFAGAFIVTDTSQMFPPNGTWPGIALVPEAQRPAPPADPLVIVGVKVKPKAAPEGEVLRSVGVKTDVRKLGGLR